MNGPVAVSELQAAWTAVQSGQFRRDAHASANASVTMTKDGMSWCPPRSVLPVIGAHRGAGTTLVALALATAHGQPAHLVECAPTVGSGLVAAATAELGPVGDWSRGTRGTVVIDRLLQLSHALPTPEFADGETSLTVVDVARDLARLVEGDDWAAKMVRSSDAVVIAAAATVPGMRQLEAAISWFGADEVAVAALGPAVRRWPRSVARAAGPLTRALHEQGRVVAVPHIKTLAVGGITAAPLPAGITKAARNLLDQFTQSEKEST